MSYLFIGEDSFSKDRKLEEIKEEFISPEVEQFNFDCLYARELDLLKLQEALLRLPIKAKKRLILIRDADKLKDNIKEYIITYFKKPLTHVLLIFDINQIDNKETFFRRISKYAKVFRFEAREKLDTFRLAQEIDRGKVNSGLKILNLLLADGERPERIMGGLKILLAKKLFALSRKK